MNFNQYLFLLIIGIIGLSCSNNKYSITKTKKVVLVQPLGEFSKNESYNLYNLIIKINPNAILMDNVPFPKYTYLNLRNRYRADSLLNFLSKMVGPDTVILGLSNRDISAKKGKYVDWGIMGLGLMSGNACVISSFRLKKNYNPINFFKLARHELGHTQGLNHCKVKTCIMRDAEGGNPLNYTKDYCSDCKSVVSQSLFTY